ncbi:MAG: tetratricopeptide repeat protein [Spirochaetaceae bacterium]|nr:tetratricopeptide repeat protein [Spirochaetaceae bacterium]MBQ3024338.1 tetratricopeptide repeat protein [Spirochaetaceae bacterium]
MEALFPILIAIIVVAVFGILLSLIFGSKNKVKKSGGRSKERQSIVRDATKKLTSDPHNVPALTELSNLYYKEHNWQGAYPLYATLVNLSSTRVGINLAEVKLRYGVCAANLSKHQEALKALLEARKLNSDVFDVNFYLGKVLVEQKEYEKAIPLLKKAITINNDVPECYGLIGKAYYLSKRYKESLPYLRRALDSNPEDKDLLFSMADALNESGTPDRAIKVFMHLRPDPVYGAQSCLAAGIYHTRCNQNEAAIKDYEIGIKHENAPQDLLLNIKYRLSQCYIKANNMPASLSLLKSIQLISPNYKDVPALITKYQELNQNSNLRTYMIGTSNEFVALCRKIASTFFKKSRTKVIDINVSSDYAELLTEINTDKWQDVITFRFYRSTGSTGELYVRDFHAKIRDEKAGRGICFTAGVFSDEARKYIEGRPIDLIEKTQLAKILSSLEMNSL